MAEVAWLTGFLDLSEETFEQGLSFWVGATGTTPSARRGPGGRFATLLPDVADGCWRVQRLDTGGAAMHLDLHAHGPEVLVASLVDLGATVVDEQDDVAVLRSPGGFPLCVVDADEQVRPGPVDWGGHTSLLDQVCLDVPEPSWDAEIAFWAAAIGTTPSPSKRRPEFVNLPRPEHLPLRFLFQVVGGEGPVTAHPDLATTDRAAEVSRLEALGARVEVVEQFWTVLRAPDGRRFCVTERDPATGQLN